MFLTYFINIPLIIKLRNIYIKRGHFFNIIFEYYLILLIGQIYNLNFIIFNISIF